MQAKIEVTHCEEKTLLNKGTQASNKHRFYGQILVRVLLLWPFGIGLEGRVQGPDYFILGDILFLRDYLDPISKSLFDLGYISSTYNWVRKDFRSLQVLKKRSALLNRDIAGLGRFKCITIYKILYQKSLT